MLADVTNRYRWMGYDANDPAGQVDAWSNSRIVAWEPHEFEAEIRIKNLEFDPTDGHSGHLEFISHDGYTGAVVRSMSLYNIDDFVVRYRESGKVRRLKLVDATAKPDIPQSKLDDVISHTEAVVGDFQSIIAQYSEALLALDSMCPACGGSMIERFMGEDGDILEADCTWEGHEEVRKALENS